MTNNKLAENSRLMLIDHERRDTQPGYKTHVHWISKKDYPPGSLVYEAERVRLREEQKIKNDKWSEKKIYNTMILSNPLGKATIASELGYRPALPKYESACTLKLDPSTGNTVLLVASSKAGKTTLQMYLYHRYFVKSIAIMFAHNPQLKIYKYKKLIVTSEFEPDIVNIMQKLNKYSNNKFDFTCLFDDQLKVKSDVIQDLFLSLRNSNISSLISLQYVNLLSKACRGNVNTILGGSMNSDENVLVFVKCYLQTFMHQHGLKSDAAMISYYRDLTRDHGFVNIHPASGEITFCRLKL